MSQNQAFCGDGEVKARLIAQLEESIAAGLIRRDHNVWNGQDGSLCGCTVKGDLDTFQRLTGIPKSLALLADKLYRQDPEAGADWAPRWLAAITPGADLAGSEGRLLRWLVAGPVSPLGQAREFEAGIGSKTEPLLRRLEALHAQADAEPEQWEALQEDAIALSDGNPEAPFIRRICNFVEALSWPAGASLTALSDGTEALKSITYSFSLMHCGWNQEWEERAQALYRRYDDEVQSLGIDLNELSKEEIATIKALFGRLAAEVPGYNEIQQDMDNYRREVERKIRCELLDCVQ